MHVTPDSVLPSRYSLRATVPYMSPGKGLEIERNTQEIWVIRKEISQMPLYSAFCKTSILWLLQKDYLPGRWEIIIPKMKQCPLANHQARAEGAQVQTGW